MVYELGLGDQIIATDRTSTYPASMQALPSIGYRNQIKAEGILALGPDVVLIEEGYLTPDVVSQLQATSVKVEIFKKPMQVEETKELVTQLAGFFGLEEKGKEVNQTLDQDLASLQAYLSKHEDKPSAAFVMARGPETLFIAGEKTFAQSMFALAGIRAVATGFDEFVPLTPESLLSINPDYLVFFDSGLESLGGKSGLGHVQGIKGTQAYQLEQVVSMDGHYLSGFGPRVGKAALELAQAVRQ